MRYLFLFLTLCGAFIRQNAIADEPSPKSDTTIQHTIDLESVGVEVGKKRFQESISIKQLKTFPAILGEHDVIKLIMMLPGVVTLGAADAGFYVRGGNSTENTFYVNGCEVINPEHFSSILSVFDNYILSNTQFYRSGYPARYDGALSSYLNLEAQNDCDSLWHGEARIGLVTSSFHTKFKAGRSHIKASLRASYIQHITRIYDRVNDDGTTVPSYSLNDATLHIHTPLNTLWSNDLFTLFSTDHMEFKKRHSTGNYYTVSASDRLMRRTNRDQFQVSFSLRQKEANAANIRPESGDHSRYGMSSFTLQSDYTRFLDTHWEVGFGLLGECSRIRLDSSDAQHFSTTAAFVSLEFHTNNLTLSGGVHGRYYHGEESHTMLSPRFRAEYKWNQMTFWCDFARTHQTITYTPLLNIRTALDVARPLPKGFEPSECDQYSAGIQWKNQSRWSLYAAAFYRRYRHVIEYKTRNIGMGFTAPSEALDGHGAARGMEFDAIYSGTKVYLRANYTLSDSWRRFAGINEGRSFHPHFDIRHNLLTNASWQINPLWRISAMWTYRSGGTTTYPEGIGVWNNPFLPDKPQYYFPIYGDYYNYRLPSAHQLDMAIDYTPSRWSYTLGVYNLYNHVNVSTIEFEPELTKDGIRFRTLGTTLLPMIPYISISYRW